MDRKKRWYDEEPTMSLAVSMLKAVSEEKKESICNEINKWLDSENIPSEKEFILFRIFTSRWYDEDELLYNLLERIRCSNDIYKQEIAVKIIDILCIYEKMETAVC